jgi:hypothetical protein
VVDTEREVEARVGRKLPPRRGRWSAVVPARALDLTRDPGVAFRAVEAETALADYVVATCGEDLALDVFRALAEPDISAARWRGGSGRGHGAAHLRG